MRRAAALLGVNHSTVSRRIDTLEARLQARVFERLASGYLMTSAGEEMLASAERIEEEMAAKRRKG